MKTAISIPDPVFLSAERVAKRLRLSRSELYTRAVRAYVEQVSSDGVTEALNAVYAKESSALDERIAVMQDLSIKKDRW